MKELSESKQDGQCFFLFEFLSCMQENSIFLIAFINLII